MAEGLKTKNLPLRSQRNADVDPQINLYLCDLRVLCGELLGRGTGELTAEIAEHAEVMQL
jgi:hypothetical protein